MYFAAHLLNLRVCITATVRILTHGILALWSWTNRVKLHCIFSRFFSPQTLLLVGLHWKYIRNRRYRHNSADYGLSGEGRLLSECSSVLFTWLELVGCLSDLFDLLLRSTSTLKICSVLVSIGYFQLSSSGALTDNFQCFPNDTSCQLGRRIKKSTFTPQKWLAVALRLVGSSEQQVLM